MGGVVFLIILLALGAMLLGVAAILLVSIWKLIAKRPSNGVAVWNLVVAAACGLYLLRAVSWSATGNLLASEWEHVALPAVGVVIFGALAALHFLGVRRDPSRV